jgi:hypothetical protein
LQVAALIPVGKEALSCEKRSITSSTAFELTSKRRKGFPSETQVKRGERLVRGSKELIEKLGRNDLCPCGECAGAFKRCCLSSGRYDGSIRNHYF